LQTTKESIKSPTKINADVKVEKIHYKEEEDRKYYCTCCGKPFNKQDGNFSKSTSPLYAGNNGYVHICKNCVNKNFVTFTDFFTGNEEKAIDRFCQIFDWYYDEDAVAASRKITANRTRINVYPSKMNLTQSANRGNTYLDTIKDRESDAINSYEQLQDVKENGNEDISERTVKRWGLGYSPAEYQMLNDHYKMLKEQINPDDPIQDAYIKDACEQHILKYRYRDTDIDKYDKVSKLYQATLANANLKPKDNTKELISNNPDECWGNFEKIIETKSPADYFSDKKIFEDYDHMDEYYKRFIERPTDNLRNGTNIMDEEFSIKANNDDE
jgi:hypothetical protein